MQITCGICGYRGDADEFVPIREDSCGPDWVCPECQCGLYAARTLTPEDLFELRSQDARP